MHMLAVGLNHTTADLALRERLAFPAERADAALAELRQWLSGLAPEAALLSTCNRTEIYCAARDPHAAEALLLQWLAKQCGRTACDIRPHVYVLPERQAVRHAFRVASGLDSMVLGETQILGQMKNAARRAHQLGALGPHLHHLYQRSFAVAKEVRSATAIGSAAVSMGAAAVRLARDTFADLAETNVLFVGAGEMIEIAARHFAAQQPRALAVATRSLARAEQLVEQCRMRWLQLGSLPEHLHEFDIVVSGTASALPIIGLGMVERAMRSRRPRPLVMVDFAVPRDIEPEVGMLRGVRLYAVDDLAHVVQSGIELRCGAVAHADAIVNERVESFMQWMAGRRLLPVLRTLEQQAERLRDAEVARARRRLARGDSITSVLESLAVALINKFLHTPRVQLGRGVITPEAAQRLVEQWLPGLASVRSSCWPQSAPGPREPMSDPAADTARKAA